MVAWVVRARRRGAGPSAGQGGARHDSPRSAPRVFLLVCLAAVVAVPPTSRWSRPGRTRRRIRRPAAGVAEFVTAVPDGPFILFRDGSPGPSFGRLAVARLPLTDTARIDWHRCRASGCTMPPDGASVWSATRAACRFGIEPTCSILVSHGGTPIPLTGPPISARVSPDGRRAVLTVFETGHSYADAAFSTRTILIETASGRRLADLEDFAIEKDGRPFKAVDFNFWGLTFAPDGDHFFATLKTGGQTLSRSRARSTRAAPRSCAPASSARRSRPMARCWSTRSRWWAKSAGGCMCWISRPGTNIRSIRCAAASTIRWTGSTTRQVIYHDSAGGRPACGFCRSTACPSRVCCCRSGVLAGGSAMNRERW